MEREDRLCRDASASTESQEYVRIPKSLYQQTVRKLQTQDWQLKASSNLHQLLQEKDEELTASRQKIEQYRSTVEQYEVSLASVIRRKDSSSAVGKLEPDSVPGDVEEDGAPHVRPPTIQPCPSERLKTSVLSTTSEVVSCSTVSYPSDCKPQVSKLPSSKPLPVQTSPLLVSTSPTSQSIVLPSVCMSCGRSSTASKDLLDKITQQNGRLKKAIREILSHKGVSMSDYLDKQEYEDAADLLRQELRRHQRLVSELKQIITSRDSGNADQLAQKCLQLAEMVSQLERKLCVMQTYADTVRVAYDKANEGKQQLSSARSSTSGPDVDSKEYEKMLAELRRLKSEHETASAAALQIRGQLEEVTRERDTLREQVQTLSQRCSQSDDHCEELNQYIADLKKENETLVTEKEFAQSQAAAFQEDFNMEQKEKFDQKKQMEQTIAKHQDWIRRLAEEAQKCRTSWQEEKAKREELESRTPELSAFSLANRLPLGCAQSVEKMDMSSRLPSTGIREDGVRDHALDSEDSSAAKESAPRICPRCEREFPPSELEKYKEHVKRCLD